MWTLFVRPLGVHMNEVPLYLNLVLSSTSMKETHKYHIWNISDIYLLKGEYATQYMVTNKVKVINKYNVDNFEYSEID